MKEDPCASAWMDDIFITSAHNAPFLLVHCRKAWVTCLLALALGHMWTQKFLSYLNTWVVTQCMCVLLCTNSKRQCHNRRLPSPTIQCSHTQWNPRGFTWILFDFFFVEQHQNEHWIPVNGRICNIRLLVTCWCIWYDNRLEPWAGASDLSLRPILIHMTYMYDALTVGITRIQEQPSLRVDACSQNRSQSTSPQRRGPDPRRIASMWQ